MNIAIDFKNEEEQLIVLEEDSTEGIYHLMRQKAGLPLLGLPLIEVQFRNGQPNVLSKDKSVTETSESLGAKLDELYLQIIENKQSGTEDNEEDRTEEKPYDPELIRVDTKTFSLHQIYDMIQIGDIELSPDFQRHFVWDKTRQSRLIESILLRIPLPMFYFSQDEEGKIAVVDGLQRLSTIKGFMDNELQLKNLEYLDSCEGKYYKTKREDKNIDPKYFRWFNMTQIVVNVIDASSPPKVKFDIFRRINTGGKPLNSQEIRNCLSKPHVRKVLNDMAHLPSFAEATLNSIKNHRMEAQEMALRFITFYDFYFAEKNENDEHPGDRLKTYTGNMAITLDAKIEELNGRSEDSVKSYVNVYDTAMKSAKHLFGDYTFRKCLLEHLEPQSRKQLINKALFISWAVVLADMEYSYIKDTYDANSLVEPLARKITEVPGLFNYFTFGTNGRVNIETAFGLAYFLLSNNKK